VRITILKSDNMVYIDGQPKTVDCSDLPADFHALQWYGTFGVIEYEPDFSEDSGSQHKPNERTDGLTPYQKYIDAWTAQQEVSDAA
jgi:hypothetical protein